MGNIGFKKLIKVVDGHFVYYFASEEHYNSAMREGANKYSSMQFAMDRWCMLKYNTYVRKVVKARYDYDMLIDLLAEPDQREIIFPS